MTQIHSTGQLGETLAVQFLEKQGVLIVTRNFRCKLGEIDIIAQDKDTVCFIEVRTRDKDFAEAFESVSFFKQRKLIKAALYFAKMKNLNDAKMRFDVIAVNLKKPQGEQIQIIKNAFDAQ